MCKSVYVFAENTHSWGEEVSLYGWCPVLQVWIEQIHYVKITTYFIFWPNPVKLETRYLFNKVCEGVCVWVRESTHVRNKERNQQTKRSEIEDKTEDKLETGKQSVYERKNDR